ncbi:MAG: choice-of-anchor V domain-containing protein, partial [Flavobacteriales bacterium]
MKKKFTLVLSMLLMVGLVYDYNYRTAHTFSAGAPEGRTGSPGDGADCTMCHSGQSTPAAGSVSITSDIPGSGYSGGATYTFTVTATDAGSSRFGFQISPQDNAGNLIGTLIASGAGTMFSGAGSDYITHAFGGTSGAGSKTWTFEWTAPSTGTGDVTFYGAFNYANDDGSTAGDVIVTETHVVTEASGVGISEAELASIAVYPNPVIDEIHIAAKDVDEEIMVMLFNVEGKKVLEERFDGGDININV